MSFCLTHCRLPETREYMSNIAQCLAHFKCLIKAICSHGIHLPTNKGSPLTAMSFAPCFHKQLPLCLLTSELCLGSAPKCSLGSDWSGDAHMHIYLSAEDVWSRGGRPQYVGPGGKTGEAHHPSEPKGSWSTSLSGSVAFSLTDWR